MGIKMEYKTGGGDVFTIHRQTARQIDRQVAH